MPFYPVAWFIGKYKWVFVHKRVSIKIHHLLPLAHPAYPNIAGNTIFVDKSSLAGVRRQAA
jgi:hypothetical protein